MAFEIGDAVKLTGRGWRDPEARWDESTPERGAVFVIEGFEECHDGPYFFYKGGKWYVWGEDDPDVAVNPAHYTYWGGDKVEDDADNGGSLLKAGDKVRLVGSKWSDRGAVVTLAKDQTHPDRAWLQTSRMSSPGEFLLIEGWEIEKVEDDAEETPKAPDYENSVVLRGLHIKDGKIVGVREDFKDAPLIVEYCFFEAPFSLWGGPA